MDSASGDLLHAITRYEENGSLDVSFGNNGSILFNGASTSTGYSNISISNDDSIFVAGTTSSSGSNDLTVSKFFSNGEIDINFGNNGHAVTDFSGQSVRFSQMMLFEENKILSIGYSNYDIVMVRHLPNGQLDTSFGTNGKLVITQNLRPQSLSFDIQDDDSIIVGVGYENFNNPAKVSVFRLSENGVLDTSFGTAGFVDIESSYFQTYILVKIDLLNNIVLGISEVTVVSGGVYGRSTAQRFDENGQIDTSFGINGVYQFNSIPRFHSINIQENNRILFAGNVPVFEGSRFFYQRLYHNGTRDVSLTGPSSYPDFDASDTVLQDDGKILVIGATHWFNPDVDFIMTRYNNNPLEVPEFNSEKFKVYPNPSNGLFTLKLSKSFSSENTYQITDVTGKIIQTAGLKDYQAIIDISEAKSGMYFLKTGNSILRLIKE